MLGNYLQHRLQQTIFSDAFFSWRSKGKYGNNGPASVVVARPQFQSTVNFQVSWPILIKLYIKHHQVGTRLQKGFGLIGLELWLPGQHIALIDL